MGGGGVTPITGCVPAGFEPVSNYLSSLSATAMPPLHVFGKNFVFFSLKSEGLVMLTVARSPLLSLQFRGPSEF